MVEQLRAVAETEEEGAQEWVDVALHMLDMSAHVIFTVDLNLTVIVRLGRNSFKIVTSFIFLFYVVRFLECTVHRPSSIDRSGST